MSEETCAPGFQRIGIVQAQDLDVGHQQAGPLDGRQHFGKRGDVAAGENVFGDEWSGGGRTFRPPDRVQQHDAVGREKLGALAEISVVEAGADVLEHAHGNDAVERSLDVAIVLEAEVHIAAESALLAALPRERQLLGGERNAGHPSTADFREIKR